jgi:DNA-binding FrmR family transcriptional regulator
MPAPRVGSSHQYEFHASNPAIIKRLKNVRGHIRSIVTMLEEGRNCPEFAQQIQAVEKAIEAAGKTPVRDHLDTPPERAIRLHRQAARAPVEEFKAITKYLWIPAGR